MDSQIWVALISALSVIIAASLSYYYTKKHQLALEWRKEKIIHYKDFFVALFNYNTDRNNLDAIKNLVNSINTIGLVADQHVIVAINNLSDKIIHNELSYENTQIYLTKLLFEMRQELKIAKKDQEGDFKFRFVEPSPKKK